ncbi:MAG: hypothetical protein QXW10_02220 [Candidatus Micrarchaeaceae archaeon]
MKKTEKIIREEDLAASKSEFFSEVKNAMKEDMEKAERLYQNNPDRKSITIPGRKFYEEQTPYYSGFFRKKLQYKIRRGEVSTPEDEKKKE